MGNLKKRIREPIKIIAESIWKSIENDKKEAIRKYGLPETATYEELIDATLKGNARIQNEILIQFTSVDQAFETELKAYANHIHNSINYMAKHLYDSPEDFCASGKADNFLIALKKFQSETLKLPSEYVQIEKVIDRYFKQAKSYFLNQNKINNTRYPTDLSTILKSP